MLVSIVVFLLFLSILIIVHELGHFIVAKKANVLVEEFGFGIPPRIFGKKIGETIYSINLFPFGGFVRLHGEEESGKNLNPKRAFVNKEKKVRAAIILAGVFMNFVLGIIAFSLFYTVNGIPKAVELGRVEILEVRKDSPAEKAGLKVGDIITEVDGLEIKTAKELTDAVGARAKKEVSILVKRGGEELNIIATPRENPPKGEGPLGIAISSTKVENTYPALWKRPFIGIYHGIGDAIFWGGLVLAGLVNMFKGLLIGVIPKDVGGPATLFVLTTQVSNQGLLAVINWVGVISVNLAILNIMPFPALDGGRILFLFIEKIFGKKIVSRVENFIHTLGLAFLVMLMLAITLREIRLIIKLGFSGYIEYLQNLGM